MPAGVGRESLCILSAFWRQSFDSSVGGESAGADPRRARQRLATLNQVTRGVSNEGWPRRGRRWPRGPRGGQGCRWPVHGPMCHTGGPGFRGRRSGKADRAPWRMLSCWCWGPGSPWKRSLCLALRFSCTVAGGSSSVGCKFSSCPPITSGKSRECTSAVSRAMAAPPGSAGARVSLHCSFLKGFLPRAALRPRSPRVQIWTRPER